jgi:N-methylhydantoinase B
VDEGELSAEVEHTFVTNSRLPDMVALDLKAQLGAIYAAQSRLTSLIEERGVETVEAVARQSVDVAENQVRERILQLAEGSWTGEAFMDGARVGDDRIHRVKVRLTRENDSLHFDFTGSSPQVDAAVNSTYHATVAGAIVPLYSFLCQGEIDWNDGVKRCVRVTAPEGTVVNATFPAPVSICTVGFRWLVTVAASQAVAKMFDASPGFRDRVCASWNVSSNCNNLFGVTPDGRRVGALLSDHRGGGAGARSFADGFNHAGQITSFASSLGNVEGAEWKLPILYVFRRQLPDSGGAGRFRGGLTAAAALVPYGIDALTLNATNTAGTEASNAHGLDGGYPGAGSQAVVVRGSNVWDLLHTGHPPMSHAEFTGDVEHLASKASTRLSGDDVLIFFAPGGGGFGDPLDREPERVARDVAENRVSPERAKSLYGVVATADGTVDAEATGKSRAAIRDDRLGGAAHPWEIEDAYRAPLHAAGTEWPVGENVVLTPDRAALACAACGHELTGPGGSVSVHSAELAKGTPWATLRWAGRSPRFHLEEVSCAGCGKLLEVREVYRESSGRPGGLLP